jgi:beta-aspartyl-peptidase (threonine type)
MTWRLMVHGGCGAMRPGGLDPEQEVAARAGLGAALDAGERILTQGGSALDAVEAAARVLEDDPVFNAGRGSVLNYDGGIDLDAAIMDGATRDAGAVAGIKTVRCPIALARAVMEQSSHVLLSFEGAEEFARKHGFEMVDNSYFETAERRAQLDKVLAAGGHFDADVKYGTIGAVAVDEAGHVAAATSTGGLTAKRWGRIGDSPLIGSGTYADDRAAAISATGSGDYFIRAVASHQVADRIRLAGATLQEAVDETLADIKEMGGTGGLIAVAPSGEAAWGFTTPGMYRGVAGPDGHFIDVYSEER